MKPLGLKKIKHFKGKRDCISSSLRKAGYVNFWENIVYPNKKAFRRENKKLAEEELSTMNNYVFADIYTNQLDWYEIK